MSRADSRPNPNVAQRVKLEDAIVPYVEKKIEPGTGHSGDAVKDLEAKLKYINETVPTNPQNIMGSTAGAGSGDFHQYRMSRRREQFRLEAMDKEAKEWEAKIAFEERRQEREAAAEARTAKRRAKRDKKKQAKKKQKRTEGLAGQSGDESSDSEDDEKQTNGDKPTADLD